MEFLLKKRYTREGGGGEKRTERRAVLAKANGSQQGPTFQ
jgi:hypothetical protein